MKTSATAIFGPFLLVTYAAILLYAAVVYLIVGHWPSSGNPDPSSLPLLIHLFFGSTTFFLMLASLMSVVVYPFLSVANLHNGTSKVWRFWAYMAIILYTVVALWIMGQDVEVQYTDLKSSFNPFLYLVMAPSLMAVVLCLMIGGSQSAKGNSENLAFMDLRSWFCSLDVRQLFFPLDESTARRTARLVV